MISHRFVTLWEPRYDTQKFPVDFYRDHRDGAFNAKHPEQLKEHLLALLHWKDGKARAFVRGENHAKPNTLNPLLTLINADLVEFAQSFQDLAQADGNDVTRCTRCTESLRDILSRMWKTVVIPAFILHVARPDRLPIIDQHTVRAWLALTEGRVDKNPSITWDKWEKYIAFFQGAVVDAGYGHNLEEHCTVDRALFAWGKSLKGSARPKPRPVKSSTSPPPEGAQFRDRPSFWGQRVPNTGIIPPTCNVLQGLQDYLDLGSSDQLPQYKKQNLRDLQFHIFKQPDLRELLQNPGGNIAQQFLRHYKREMGGRDDLSILPRPILDVFLVGWANMNGIVGTTQMADYLYKLGFGGTVNASMAAVQVGKTTGRLFGLLDNFGTPTALFREYFDV